MEYLDYYKKGLLLLKNNLDIYAVYVILFALIRITPAQQSLLKIILILLNFGFFLTIPKILNIRENNKISYKEITKLSLQNSKRTIVPFILFIIIVEVFFIVLIGILSIFLHTDNKTITLIFVDLLIILVTLVSPFGGFINIFFSIKNENILQSIIKSIKFSVKNIKFSILIIPYSLLVVVVGQLLKNTLSNLNAISITYNLVVLFLGLLINCSFYLFWKKNYRG